MSGRVYYIPKPTRAEEMRSLWSINQKVSDMCRMFPAVDKLDIDLDVIELLANYEPTRRTA